MPFLPKATKSSLGMSAEKALKKVLEVVTGLFVKLSATNELRCKAENKFIKIPLLSSRRWELCLPIVRVGNAAWVRLGAEGFKLLLGHQVQNRMVIS